MTLAVSRMDRSDRCQYVEYCTMTTLSSQGVTRDGRERCQVKFTGEKLMWQHQNMITFRSKSAYRPQKIKLLWEEVHGWPWLVTKHFRCSIHCCLWRVTEPKIVIVQYFRHLASRKIVLCLRWLGFYSSSHKQVHNLWNIVTEVNI